MTALPATDMSCIPAEAKSWISGQFSVPSGFSAQLPVAPSLIGTPQSVDAVA